MNGDGSLVEQAKHCNFSLDEGEDGARDEGRGEGCVRKCTTFLAHRKGIGEDLRVAHKKETTAN
jgi:uncharacterized protein (DUF2237 family)